MKPVNPRIFHVGDRVDTLPFVSAVDGLITTEAKCLLVVDATTVEGPCAHYRIKAVNPLNQYEWYEGDESCFRFSSSKS